MFGPLTSTAIIMSVTNLEAPPPSRDEDVVGEKKSRQRQPKSREKWSLLWFIPPSVLNDREISYDGKKGKRHGFDRFNSLSCKVCHASFHNSEVLSMHKAEAHQASDVPSRYLPSPSIRSRSSLSSFSGPVRRSSRRSYNNSINYCDDDDIEILDGASHSYSTPTRASRNKTSEIEEVCIDDDDSIEEVAVEPDIPIFGSSSVQITHVTNKEDEEVLLMDDTPEDDDDIEVLESNKRKHSPRVLQENKKSKTSDPLEVDADDVIEIQSSSGKSMFVKKSLLNRVGLSPPPSRHRSLGL